MVAEQIPYGVAASIINRLASLAFREIGLIYGVNSELEKLRETLESIKVVLSDAEEKRQDLAVEHWIKRFKEVLHEADDLLDDLATKELQRKVDGRGEIVKKVSDFFSSSNQIVFHRKIARKINKIREQFNCVAEDMSKLNFNQGIIVIKQNENDWRETSSFVDQFEIVGREESKNEIVKMLFQPNSNQNVSLVAIVGMGGLGKTTLAQLVYNDCEVMKFFQKRMWVYVSENFEVKSLVKKILESSINHEVRDLQLELLQNQLRESLNGQKFLLVLDDVWNDNHESWNQLRSYLMCGAQGSKILATTRNGIVAERMGVDVSYDLRVLTEKKSWELFEKLAFRETARKMNLNFVSIGKKIAEKCGGVPLALKTLGSLLHFKRFENEWVTIMNSEFGEQCLEKNSIMRVLKLSYNHLPVELRQCFAYCSLYPKGSRIEREKLIHFWMAQDYLQPTTESQCLDELGNDYIKTLLMWSFFQDVETDQYGDIVSFKMHDLLHDLAQLVAGGDCCLYTSERMNVGRPMHASFEFGPIPSLGLSDAKKLRTILRPSKDLVHAAKIPYLPRFKRLRILDLSCSFIIKLPKSVGKLKHLRYLNLSYCIPFKSLPRSIGNLVNLQTLDLSSCHHLRSLPRSIGNLVNLQTLNLYRCYELVSLPKSFTKLISLKHLICENNSPISSLVQVGLGNLTSLQYLSEVEFVVGENIANEIVTLNKLKDLNDLRGDLHIKNLSLVQDVTSELKEVNLNRKRYIKSLTLDWGDSEDNKNSDSLQLLDNLHPHQNLKSLTVLMYPGVGFSNWISSLSNVGFISLVGFENCSYLPPLEGLASLKSLAIRRMDALEYIYIESYQESSPTTASSSLLMPTRVFFPSLQSLQLIECPNLCGWKWIHQQHQLDLLLPPFPHLSSLTITNCGNLTCMPTFPYLVEEMTLSACNVKSLMDTLVMNTVTSTATQEDSILALESSFSTSLSKLKFMDIGKTQIEALLDGWIRGLTSLERLSLEGFDSLASLFPSMGHLPATLKHLTISQVDDVSILWNDHEGASSSTTQHQVLHNPPTLQSIDFIFCRNLFTLPEWICNISSLRSITIENDKSVFYPPEGMRRLTNLKILLCPPMEDTDEVRARIAHIPNIISGGKVFLV